MNKDTSTEQFKIVDIARSQLETAIRLFFYAEDYFSVTTLAGASEEILGRILEEIGKETAHSSFARTYSYLLEVVNGVKISERDVKRSTNRARNTLKHFNSMKDLNVVLNPRKDAIDMLCRATENYSKLNLPESNVIDRFLTYESEYL